MAGRKVKEDDLTQFLFDGDRASIRTKSVTAMLDFAIESI